MPLVLGRETLSEEFIVQVEKLKKHFPLKKGFLSTVLTKEQETVKAVDGVSYGVKKGEILGLAGESGSGKTTTGRLMIRLEKPTEGSIYFEGKDITKLGDRELRPLRRDMQIIFQDPFESLDPRMTVKSIIAEPLRIQKIAKTEEEVEERVKKMLTEVELVPPEEFLLRFPHELSGGQRQRVAVARAFILGPKFVVADEPVSMLDVSIRAEILNLMLNLVQKQGASFIYITHDLALAKHICDRVVIMYLGKIMEMANSDRIIDYALHPYTKALIAAVPIPDPSYKRTDVISGEIPSPVNPPSGCRFHTRCPYAHERCVTEEPSLVETEKDHFVACHLYT
jgi:peptide/nickel transport system ATP-binding protein